MSSTTDTLPVAGTVSACDTCAPAIYLREWESDYGSTGWRILKNFGQQSQWSGVVAMTTFGSNGYAYYASSLGGVHAAHRFTVTSLSRNRMQRVALPDGRSRAVRPRRRR